MKRKAGRPFGSKAEKYLAPMTGDEFHAALEETPGYGFNGNSSVDAVDIGFDGILARIAHHCGEPDLAHLDWDFAVARMNRYLPAPEDEEDYEVPDEV